MARRSRKIKRSRSRKVRRVSQKRKSRSRRVSQKRKSRSRRVSRKGGRKRRTKKRISRKMKGGAEGIGKEYYFKDREAWQQETGNYPILTSNIEKITKGGVAIMGDGGRAWSHVYETKDDAEKNKNGINIKSIIQQMHNEKEEDAIRLKQAEKRLAPEAEAAGGWIWMNDADGKGAYWISEKIEGNYKVQKSLPQGYGPHVQGDLQILNAEAADVKFNELLAEGARIVHRIPRRGDSGIVIEGQ
jgi:hypothetical protein